MATTDPAVTHTPLLASKAYSQKSVFLPGNLLREARRQKNLPHQPVPRVCLLDPDGDVTRHLAAGHGHRHEGWACYHTDMWVADLTAFPVGVVGCAVGAPFAVLVAEQLFASGAELVISITSAGQLRSLDDQPSFVLIDRALRDEGTSLHYQPPGTWSRLDPDIKRRIEPTLHELPENIVIADSWTTDAPYRETTAAIAAATAAGACCVEMEAAALYALAASESRQVVCLAHITNTMAVAGDDFEKGHANGVPAALAVAAHLALTLTGQPETRRCP